jgi:hypothetical protein
MFGAQAALVSWRKKHKRSYDLATLFGLWVIPPIISVQLGACPRMHDCWKCWPAPGLRVNCTCRQCHLACKSMAFAAVVATDRCRLTSFTCPPVSRLACRVLEVSGQLGPVLLSHRVLPVPLLQQADREDSAKAGWSTQATIALCACVKLLVYAAWLMSL